MNLVITKYLGIALLILVATSLILAVLLALGIGNAAGVEKAMQLTLGSAAAIASGLLGVVRQDKPDSSGGSVGVEPTTTGDKPKEDDK